MRVGGVPFSFGHLINGAGVGICKTYSCVHLKQNINGDRGGGSTDELIVFSGVLESLIAS